MIVPIVGRGAKALYPVGNGTANKNGYIVVNYSFEKDELVMKTTTGLRVGLAAILIAYAWESPCQANPNAISFPSTQNNILYVPTGDFYSDSSRSAHLDEFAPTGAGGVTPLVIGLRGAGGPTNQRNSAVTMYSFLG